EVYDFVEWLLNSQQETNNAIASLNNALEDHLSGYRFIENKIAPIVSSEEITSVKTAIDQEDLLGSSKHLQQALTLLSDRAKPDYRNSIKESICAVESAVRQMAGKPKATLRDAITELEKRQPLHPALREGILRIYGYTSDEEGVRHAMQEEPDIGQSDAVF